MKNEDGKDMKSGVRRAVVALIAVSLCLSASAQRERSAKSKQRLEDEVAMLASKVDSLMQVIESMRGEFVPVRKEINPNWEKWNDVRYNYGFNPEEQPIYNTVDGVLESSVMLSVRGGRGRWNSESAKPKTHFADGGHVFEGWNATETCRLTMLIGKQAPDIACIQVYSPRGLYRQKRHFGWVKIGSDSRCEGVDFGRRWAKSFVPFTLAALSETPTDTMYVNEQLGSDSVPVGTIYYDAVAERVRCYTKSGWKYLVFE